MNIQKLIARWDRQEERAKAAKRKRTGTKIAKLLAAGEKDKAVALMTAATTLPKAKLDTSPEAIDDRQHKLVAALFNGASLSRAWRHAGFSASHHANWPKVLSSPTVRALMKQGLDRGERLRGKAHAKVTALLAEPDVFDIAELL